jgi:probable phosphoglycerate mutase
VTQNILELTVVRHGETDWNLTRRIQGQIDVPLNATGVAQARAVASTLRATTFQGIVSSDLMRAQQTAQPNQNGRLPIILEASLRERQLGVLEGLLVSEAKVKAKDDLKAFLDKSYITTPEGAETMDAFGQRVLSALTTIYCRFNKGNILITTHGGVIDVLWRLAQKDTVRGNEKSKIGNGSIHQFIYNHQTRNIALKSFNQTSHLNHVTALVDL